MKYEVIKRAIDVFGSLILLIFFFPIMLATAIAIKVTSSGPVFVEKENKHMQRLGKGRKMFRLFKFRSMMVKADVLEKTPSLRIYILKRKKWEL
jgi:lipopolysaccharide/colanic/teichoic acid biosynthesis glycosyltransferase